MGKYSDFWLDIFSEKEIDDFLSNQYKNHPFTSLLKYPNENYNTVKAIEKIKQSDINWLKNKKNRLLIKNEKEKDIGNINGALGEIRAYGNLLNTDIDIKPYKKNACKEKKKNFDFIIKSNIEMEVQTPCINFDELDEINNINQSKKECRAKIIMPYGAIDEYNNSSTEHAIYKLSQIKAKYKQFSDSNNVKILWIDVQSKYMDILKPEYILPIRTDNGNIFSGVIWYAFWGRFGLPIFHGEHKIEHSCMKHYGKFLHPNAPDYAILSFKNKTIMLENCYSENKLSYETLFYDFFKLQNFSLQYSYLNFKDNNLKNRIFNELEYIKSFKDNFDKLP